MANFQLITYVFRISLTKTINNIKFSFIIKSLFLKKSIYLIYLINNLLVKYILEQTCNNITNAEALNYSKQMKVV